MTRTRVFCVAVMLVFLCLISFRPLSQDAFAQPAPEMEYDAHILDDAGFDPFYERFWGTLSVIDGDRVVRDDGGAFDQDYVGRILVLKFADETRYPGVRVAGYYTIKSVIDERTVELDAAPDFPVQDEAGYIYGDNDAKFRELLDTALNSGKVYSVFIPRGATIVLPGSYRINNTLGGVHFFSEPTDDPFVGGASIKFMKEEDPDLYVNWFYWARADEVGEFDVIFENINLVARDNYSFKTEDNHILFQLPHAVNLHRGFTLKVKGSDFAYEYNKYLDDVRGYLARRFEIDDEERLEELRHRYYLWARPKLVQTLSAGSEESPFIWHMEDVNAWYVRFYEVSNSLFNRTDSVGYRSVMRNVKAYGTLDHGRNGITRNSLVHPLVNIAADAEGDFTVMTLSPDSPIDFDFTALDNLYHRFSRKRPGHGIDIEIENVTQTNDEIPGALRRDFIFINQSKNREGSAVRLGTVDRIYDRGDGVYDLVLDRDPDVVIDRVGGASGGFERVGGVIQYDYICSDAAGALTENRTGDNPTDMIDRDLGYPNDYRGWTRYVYGDPANGQFFDGGDDWPRRGSAWIWLDNDQAGQALNRGDKLYIINAEHANMTAIVEPDGKTVRYIGTNAQPTVAPDGNNNKYIEIDGRFYEYALAGGYRGDLDETGGGYTLEIVDAQAPPGRYAGINIWYETWINDIVVEPGAGTRVNLWSTENHPLISIYNRNFFAPDSEARPGHPENPPVGNLLFAINVKVGNRAEFPNGAPFVEGETLYSYYLGTGADHAAPARRLQTGRVILPKEWAVAWPVENARLKLFTDPSAGGTHWVYGKHRGVQHDWENVRFEGGNLSLIIRDGGNHPDGSVFKDCDLSYGPGMQIGGPITVDGGKYRVYGGGGEMRVRNAPRLYGAARSFNIIDETGDGWYVNDEKFER